MCNLKIAPPKWLSKWLRKPNEQDVALKTLAKKIKDLEQSLSKVSTAKPEPPVVEVEPPVKIPVDSDKYPVREKTGRYDHTELYQAGTHLLFNIPRTSLLFLVNYLNWSMDRREYYKEDKDASFDIEIIVSQEFVDIHYSKSSMGTRRKQARHFTGILRQLKMLKVIPHTEYLRGRMQNTDRLIYIHGRRKSIWTIDKLVKESERRFLQNNISKLHGWGT
jgi:hypothetical protein